MSEAIGMIETQGLTAVIEAIDTATLADRRRLALAADLAERGLPAGEVVLGGSFTRPVPAQAGDTFHADYGPLGAVSFRFV